MLYLIIGLILIGLNFAFLKRRGKPFFSKFAITVFFSFIALIIGGYLFLLLFFGVLNGH